MSVINLTPKVVDLNLYAGDAVTLAITARDLQGNIIDVQGTVLAQIRQRSWSPTVVDSFTVDMSHLGDGLIYLNLTGDQTTALYDSLGGYGGVWDLQWTPDANPTHPTTLVKGKVSVDADVSH